MSPNFSVSRIARENVGGGDTGRLAGAPWPLQLRHYEIAAAKSALTPPERAVPSLVEGRARRKACPTKLQRRRIVAQQGFADDFDCGEALAEKIVMKLLQRKTVALFFLKIGA
jgi:hypothetical protein